jgi:predicted DNA-binding protein YlxM (UPF0122 family)
MAKNKGGRPEIELTDAQIKLAHELLKVGASIKEVAANLEIGRTTLYEIIERDAKFANTIKKGVEYSEAWWEANGRLNIHNKEFNSTLWYMNMKNRFGWKDKTESTVTATVKHEDALKELE